VLGSSLVVRSLREFRFQLLNLFLKTTHFLYYSMYVRDIVVYGVTSRKFSSVPADLLMPYPGMGDGRGFEGLPTIFISERL
jgi:hypothetical protein